MDKTAYIAAVIRPLKVPMSMFHSFQIVAFIFSAIWPYFYALSLLLICKPVAGVLGPIVVHIYPVAICLIIAPFALINVTIRMDQPTWTIGFSIDPKTFIYTAIYPMLTSFTFSLSLLVPLTNVECAILQLYRLFTL